MSFASPLLSRLECPRARTWCFASVLSLLMATGLVVSLACSSSAPETGSGGQGGALAMVGGQPVVGGTTATGGVSGQGGARGTCLTFGKAKVVGTVEATDLTELSGLVASRVHPGVLYAHADVGVPLFVAMDTAGKTLGTFTVLGAGSQDWEDISVGKGPDGTDVIFIGDIGDNSARDGMGKTREQIAVYRVPEPDVSVGQAAVVQTLTQFETLLFTYPDRPHDAETLMVDPITGDILIVTKEDDGNSSVFRASGTTPVRQSTVLEKVAGLTFGVPGSGSAHASAGDISPSGDRILIRTHTAILLWPRLADAGWDTTFAAAPRSLPAHDEPQGEGLTFAADGHSWFSAGESDPTIYQGKENCP